MGRSIDKIEGNEAAHAVSAPPEIALLSNGRYNVLITEAGSGFGSWRGIDVTRWREDGTRDCWGQYCYIRDLGDGKVWSIGQQPLRRADASYERSFLGDRASFRCSVGNIDVWWEDCVAPDCDAEVRLIRLHNRAQTAKELELTSYSEICLNSRRADSAHPAFAKLFIETWFDTETTALFARRRPRSATENPIWAVHVSASSELETRSVEYETDRYRFVGRGRTPSDPAAMDRGRNLSATTGPVLDPVFSLRRTVVLEPNETRRIAFVTGAADNEADVKSIARRFADVDAADRALSDATKKYADELATSRLTPSRIGEFNRLASKLAFSYRSVRHRAAISTKRPSAAELWSIGISGDLPILLLRIDKPNQNVLVDDVIDAHTFITSRGLPFDLVLLDENGTGEAERLRERIEGTDVEGSLGKPGGLHVLNAAAISQASIDAIAAAARVILCCSAGSLADQIEGKSGKKTRALEHTRTAFRARREKSNGATRAGLLFWNAFGGFTLEGREYVISVDGEVWPPLPWCNVIANHEFGCMTSESGLGYTWAGNSQLNRLTPWSNDPVTDAPSEVIYLRDEQTGEIWTPTPLPRGQSLTTTVRHGQGYSCYESAGAHLRHEMTVHVPVSEPIKIIRLVLHNDGPEARVLTVTYFLEWVLGTLRENASARVNCELDAETGAVIARSIWESDFSERLIFVASSIPPRSFTCDRSEFLGRNGSVSQPMGLVKSDLSGSVGTVDDPCAALMVEVTVPPAQNVELVFVLGQAATREECRRLVREYAEPGRARRSLEAASEQWDRLLSAVTVRTPDTAFDLMMNRWLLYQVLSCRVWGRTGFYQSGGAYGFRDQLQDVAALVHCAPEETRAHILRAAARQFAEGDVQHWWHPPSGVGIRTRMTDDLYFLPYVVQHYVSVTGDDGLLSEEVPFITSPPLDDDQEECFGVPRVSEEHATIYEHCCRALERGLRLGSHGIPLMGTGDWNDGMNKVGADGKGESVWNGWFFLTVLTSFAEIASARGDEDRAAWCREQAEALRSSLEAHAWDGSWYRRAYFDDGTPLGSCMNDECQIDAIPQAWAVISSAADVERASEAMQAVWTRLVRPDDKLIKLFDPPFDKGALQPGYIKGYVPGIRENGGQYTHADAWVVLATALIGDGDRGFQLWSMLNPINHALSPAEARRYMVEPYVVSADVYGAAPHTGRGGWTWYTGSAAWLYRVGLEAILGIRRRGRRLFIDPCMPMRWPGYEVDFRYGSTVYHIRVNRAAEHGTSQPSLTVDGEALTGAGIPLADDGRIHAVNLVVGWP